MEQTQPQEQSPPIQYLATFMATSVILGGSIFGSHYLRSENVEPEFVCAGDSVYFEIPQDTRRKTLLGFGPEREVARMEIELICRDTQERKIFTLTKEFPYKECSILPNTAYIFKSRSQDDGCFWSKRSKQRAVVSKFPCFTLSAGDPSRAKCEDYILKLKQGPPSNILVFGRPGSGKSSFINSLFTSIAGSYQHVANTSPEGFTNTQGKTPYELIPGKVYIHDTPGWEKGWEKDAWRMSILEKVLKAELNDMTVSQLRGDSHDFVPMTPGYPINKIDVVILVMSAITLKENKDFHKQITELLKKLGIPCFAVVTKMDLIVSDENKPVSRNRFFQDPRVIARYQQAPVDDRFPLINYNPNEINKPENDELLLHMIKIWQEKSRKRSIPTS